VTTKNRISGLKNEIFVKNMVVKGLSCFLKQAQLGDWSDQGTVFCFDFGYANPVITARESLENTTKEPSSPQRIVVDDQD